MNQTAQTAFDRHLEANRHRMRRQGDVLCRCCGRGILRCGCDVELVRGSDREETAVCHQHERRVEA